MTRIANVGVGGKNPVRIMGILNTSPESFYKKSISTTKNDIKNSIKQMEDDGADFIDIGGMSTAPYLSTIVSEKVETRRILDAIKIAQNNSNLPISIDKSKLNGSISENQLGTVGGLFADALTCAVIPRANLNV